MRNYLKVLLALSVLGIALATEPSSAAEDPLSGAEAHSMQGDYALEDGKTLSIIARGRHLYAQIGNGPSVKLVTRRESSMLTSRDGSIAVVFDTVPFPSELVRVILRPEVRRPTAPPQGAAR